ncbi:hypothetical protein OMW55_07000 [Sphingomonas sp. BN140010]|uniref:Aa3-type cytochrome c oxidase subunit IV n=1 Tax=Sphingomonas arvum TaxID=2992113 RepID=A0ABT3JER6_9SPHN|nr:hypothetical protein [Sphingomonas sp. BN140010]MCW3797548.1 hypothetical protein [Sphingomonas sp. BN140010]
MSIHTSEPNGNPVEFKRHVNDYTRVMALLKWGGIASLVVALLVVIIIAS